MSLETLPIEKLINDLCNAAARVGVENSGLVITVDCGDHARMKKYAAEVRRRLEAVDAVRAELEEANIERDKARLQIVETERRLAASGDY